ncbi:MAG: protease modulator HflC [Cellvibrionaceae bacterium]|nr:protease modulator HflC [Cellvibrionaceae bacterium]
MKKLIYACGALVFAVYLAATSVVIVKPSEYALITQFGKVVRNIDAASLYLKLPEPIQSVSRFDKRLQVLNLAPAELGTRDRRNVIIENFVLWKIQDPMQYQASVRERKVAEQRIESLIYSEVGSAIGGAQFNDLFAEAESSTIESVFSTVTESVAALASSELGIAIVAVRPARISFPQQNLLSIYKRMESEWTRQAKQLRAEGREEAANIKSQTEKSLRELKAKAYKESQIIIGEGEAKAAQLYAEAFYSNQDYYRFTRKMETYKKLFNKDTQIILSTGNPLVRDLLEPPSGKP